MPEDRFLTLESAKESFDITSDDLDSRLLPLVSAANTAVSNAIRAKNPDIEILEGTRFFDDARQVALVHFEADLKRQINHLYDAADKAYKSYETRLAALIEAVWGERSPRTLAETTYEEDIYRPFGQDFGVSIDY